MVVAVVVCALCAYACVGFHAVGSRACRPPVYLRASAQACVCDFMAGMFVIRDRFHHLTGTCHDYVPVKYYEMKPTYVCLPSIQPLCPMVTVSVWWIQSQSP